MAAISQKTLSNSFSWMKMLKFWIKFHWSLFIRVQLTISQHWLRWRLGTDQATSHYLNQWWIDYRRIYASLGLNELMSSHYLNQCWFIVNCTLRNRFQSNLNQNKTVSIQWNELENMTSAKWQPFCLQLNVSTCIFPHPSPSSQGSFWVWAQPMRDNLTI